MPSDMSQRGMNENGVAFPDGETVADYETRQSLLRNYGRWAALRENGEISEFRFLYVDPDSDPNQSRFFDALENATGVWLPAYDQSWLPQQFADDYPQKVGRFQLALRRVVERGGVVGGLGGGAACLAETTIASDHRESSGWIRAKLRFGLALFDGAVVDQNFDSHTGRLERLTDLLRSGPRLDRSVGVPGVGRRTIGIGVGRNAALILKENTARVIGENRAHIFLQGNGDRTITWMTLSPGEPPVEITSRGATSVQSRRENAFQHALNPFGLPLNNDCQPCGTVVLHGGRSNHDIVDLVLELTPNKRPRLVHCPAAVARYRPSEKCYGDALVQTIRRDFGLWSDLVQKGKATSVEFLTTSNRADANNPDFVAPLLRADGLWFSGGDQGKLSELLIDPRNPTLFQKKALNILRRGGVVGGTSAGLAVMPEIIINGGISVDRRPAKADLGHGLGVLRNVLAEQHFDARSGRIERFTSLLRNHERLTEFHPGCQPVKFIGLAVEEDTALIVSGNELRVAGRNLAHVFLQFSDRRVVTWHALHAGDVAVTVSRGADYELVLDDWQVAQ